MTIDLDVAQAGRRRRSRSATQKWSKKAPGPWLEDPKPATARRGPSIGKILQSLVKVDRPRRRDEGRRAAPSPHRSPGTDDHVRGARSASTRRRRRTPKFTLDFYATDAGVPAIMSMSGAWTQVSGAHRACPATMDVRHRVQRRRHAADDQRRRPMCGSSTPRRRWAIRWRIRPTGRCRIGEERGHLRGRRPGLRLRRDEPRTRARPRSSPPTSRRRTRSRSRATRRPRRRRSSAASRRSGSSTSSPNDTGQDVTVADDVVSRDGTGWEVYLATARRPGGHRDLRHRSSRPSPSPNSRGRRRHPT